MKPETIDIDECRRLAQEELRAELLRKRIDEEKRRIRERARPLWQRLLDFLLLFKCRQCGAHNYLTHTERST